MIITLLDPSMGPRYAELTRDEEETREIDNFYKMTATPDDYINPTMDSMLRWHCASSCTSDSKQGLENWLNKMHEVSRRRCAWLTNSLRWIGTEVCEAPMFDGLSTLENFYRNTKHKFLVLGD